MLGKYQGDPIRGYGPTQLVARSYFTGAASTPTLVSAYGISAITRTAVGVWTVTLQEKLKEFQPIIVPIGASTVIHDCPVTAIDYTAGTFEFKYFKSATDRTTTPSVAADGTSPSVVFGVFVFGNAGL